MNFNSRSCRWTITECAARPEDLIRSLIDAVVAHLPANSLGHVKGYVEFDNGSVFASSTLIPPEVTLQQNGKYRGGGMRMNITLIFSDMGRETMARALELARKKTEQRWNCTMEEVAGGIGGD